MFKNKTNTKHIICRKELLKHSNSIYSIGNNYVLVVFLFAFILLFPFNNHAQDRFTIIEAKLKEISKEAPGLNEKVELSINGATIQEFIRGIATSNGLNVSVDGSLNNKVINNFSNVSVAEVFLFLCKRYELDISFVGSIMSFSAFNPPVQVPVKPIAKTITVNYDKSTDRISLDLTNDSITSVAKEITRATQKNVVFSPDLMNRLLSGYIQNMPFLSALDKLAFANDLKVTPTEDNFYLIEKKDATPSMANGNNSNKRNDNKSGNKTLPPGVTLKVDNNQITSIDVNNTPIADALSAISNELKTNYFLFTEIKGNTTLSITNVTYEEFLKYLLNGTEYTFKKQGDFYLIGDRAIEGLRTTKTVQLKYRTVEKMIDFIPADLKKGVDIKPFMDLNSLILSGSQPRIEEIEDFLRQVDRVVPVIAIEVLIVDVSNSKTLSDGIEAGLGKAPTATGGITYPTMNLSLGAGAINNIISGLNGTGLVNLGKVTPNFYVTLKALETQGILNIRSTPKLATLNGHEAKMSIGETQYYAETQTTVQGSVATSTQQSINYKSVNADLAITINPIVSGDDQITMDISVKQSSFTARISNTAPPGTISRNFQSMIRVKNEEMIILGGLEKNSINESGSGVPFLSRIPIIKWLFSSRTREKAKSKLTIFIKPTVIY